MKLVADNFFGEVKPPQGISEYGNLTAGGAVRFGNNIIKLMITAAGLFTLVNIVSAGFSYISAGGDPKKIDTANSKITFSIIGLIITAGSFVIAAIIGWLVFKDPAALLNPTIYGP